ncbi:hypothetical protein [Thermoactinomyces sp. CICC 10521]|uniref:hypothetical protein n=1 Tax=Thermoactinomyces sp. CICC 10521 TaxID=2767426 RepID=UPI0018DDF19B|nr:hypothetical protein [Thermoactinomyces sp. CICC 10521]MBH8608768.1 hypothetical protein [Thermoactinomyces sp. CICC 10521]
MNPTAKKNHPTMDLNLFSNLDTDLDYLEKRAKGQDVALLDVGGYFAGVLNELAEVFSGRIMGVVEDTENGYQR